MRRTAKVKKSALFEALGYTPHPGQAPVHASTAHRRVLACGVRWGKSTCAAMEAAAALLSPASKSIGWIVGPTLDLSDRVFLRVVAAIRARFEHRIESFELRERRLVVRNLGGGRSEVRGKSADRPVTLLGEGLDWLIVDEAARLDESVWIDHLSARLVDREGWALLLSTPNGDNWFLEAFRRGSRWKQPGWESWQSRSSENPLLDPVVIEAQRATLSPEAFREQFEAEFIGGGPERCPKCGNPSPDARGVVFIAGDLEPQRCDLCGEVIDERGKTAARLNPDGTIRMRIERWPSEMFWHDFVYVPRTKVVILPWKDDPLSGELGRAEDAEFMARIPTNDPAVLAGLPPSTDEAASDPTRRE